MVNLLNVVFILQLVRHISKTIGLKLTSEDQQMVNFFAQRGYTNSTLLREALHHYYCFVTDGNTQQSVVDNEKQNTLDLGDIDRKIDEISEKLSSLYTCYDALSEVFEQQTHQDDSFLHTQNDRLKESHQEHKELKKNLLSFRM